MEAERAGRGNSVHSPEGWSQSSYYDENLTNCSPLQEQEQLAAIREQLDKEKESVPDKDKDFEGGFGGQEDLEDRYATTSGDH